MYRAAIVLFALLSASICFAEDHPPLLLHHPTLSATQIVFVYAGDLWSVPREGGDARRLTAGNGAASRPVFSPDGTEIAFTGDYDGNADVYVIPANGGTPRRLTYHPAPDAVIGWTRDGKHVLFASNRASNSRFNRLFTISREGGFPSELPLPIAAEGSYSPDGQELAYVPLDHAFEIWKRYRGGRTSPVWIARLADSSVTQLPRDNSNDFNPMWIDHRVFFLSDRNGPMSLFSYDTRTKSVTQALKNDSLDFKYASAGPDAIAIEQFGAIWLYDLKSGAAHKVDIHIAGDLPQLRPRYVNVASRIRSAAISPTGLRAAFEARGEILTVPAEKGDIHNLTNTPGADERYPAWSPDGTRIAYFSDESGEYRPVHQEPEWQSRCAENRSRHSRIVFLFSHLVARQQENRLYRQAPEPLVRRSRKEITRKSLSRPFHRPAADFSSRLVPRQQMAGLHASRKSATCVLSFSIRSKRARAIASPTA